MTCFSWRACISFRSCCSSSSEVAAVSIVAIVGGELGDEEPEPESETESKEQVRVRVQAAGMAGTALIVGSTDIVFCGCICTARATASANRMGPQ